MENNGKRGKSQKARLGQLAQAMIRCVGPDVYSSQGEAFQQINVPPFKSGDYTGIAPEQLLMLARVKTCSSLARWPGV
jgi:hypothetical protein